MYSTRSRWIRTGEFWDCDMGCNPKIPNPPSAQEFESIACIPIAVGHELHVL